MDNSDFYDEIVKEAAGGPIGGFGKPFSDDPLATSQFSGPGPNPAAATGPYQGDTDTSINNVGPYTGEEEVNPASDTAPYAPPTGQPVEAAYKAWNERDGWFDGETATIYSRIIEAEQLRVMARTAGAHDISEALDEQIAQLRSVASEYDNSILQEHVESLPGGTVALEYDNPIEGGLVDLGIGDQDSWLYAEAAKVVNEARDYDWHAFKFEGARRWVEDKTNGNPGMLRHSLATRQAAVNYARDKTMVLLDPVRRADIIDGFVNSVERYRREAATIAERAEDEREKVSFRRDVVIQHREIEAAYEDFEDTHGAGVTVAIDPNVIDGRLDIGEDDGSAAYYDAREILSRVDDADWQFEASSWATDQVETSPDMFNHPEIYKRAAFDRAREKTAMVFDGVERQQKVATFLEIAEDYRQRVVKLTAESIQKTAAEEIITTEDTDFAALQAILDEGEEPGLW